MLSRSKHFLPSSWLNPSDTLQTNAVFTEREDSSPPRRLLGPDGRQFNTAIFHILPTFHDSFDIPSCPRPPPSSAPPWKYVILIPDNSLDEKCRTHSFSWAGHVGISLVTQDCVLHIIGCYWPRLYSFWGHWLTVTAYSMPDRLGLLVVWINKTFVCNYCYRFFVVSLSLSSVDTIFGCIKALLTRVL